MTGERELPEGESSGTGGEEEVLEVGIGAEIGSGVPDWERSSGAKNPTWRIFGSLTVRAARRGSIWGFS